MRRDIFDEDHRIFRDSFREFVKREITPFHEHWEQNGIVPRDVWRKAGEQGFLCMSVPEDYGGAGVADYRYNMIVNEELTRVGASGPGFSLHSDMVLPYLLSFANEEQNRRWLPRMVSGEWISAIAMTEPGAGSDLAGVKTTAVWDGNQYVVNGSKTLSLMEFRVTW